MISLDQVLLLEEKVESAVQKIAQLNQENDALRMKCSELTKALSEKTEQLSSFSSDQNKIEEGILKALERLNSVEHSVLKAAALNQQIQQQSPVVENTATAPQAAQPASTSQAAPTAPVQAESEISAETDVKNQNEVQTPVNPAAENSAKDDGQFYIF